MYKNQLIEIYPLYNLSNLEILINLKSKLGLPTNLKNNEILEQFLNRIIKSNTLVIGATYTESEKERLNKIDENYIGIDLNKKNNPIPIDFLAKNKMNLFINEIINIRGKKFDNIIVDKSVYSILFFKDYYNIEIIQIKKQNVNIKEKVNTILKEFKESDEFGRSMRPEGLVGNNYYQFRKPKNVDYIYIKNNIDIILSSLKENGTFLILDIPNREDMDFISKFIKKYRPDIKLEFKLLS